MRRLALLSLLVMFCCVLGAAAATLAPGDPAYVPEDPLLAKLVGQPAPALTLKSIDGTSINLAKLYGKRPVYLKLWATYCLACRAQMPGFKSIYAAHGNQMTIIAVNAGVGDDIGKAKQFVQDFDLRMPVAIDDGRLGAWIGMKGTPVHLIIGRDGRVIFAGNQDGPALDAAISQALASKAAPVSTTALAALVTLKPGDAIPPITLRSSDGKDIILPHGPSTRPRAIYFSATWCESYMKLTQQSEADRCQAGREQADTLAAGQTIEWFGVMNHLWMGPKALANYVAKMTPPFPLALDTTGEAFRTFGVKRFPALALIDTNGRLIKLVEGDPAQFPAAISSLQASK